MHFEENWYKVYNVSHRGDTVVGGVVRNRVGEVRPISLPASMSPPSRYPPLVPLVSSEDVRIGVFPAHPSHELAVFWDSLPAQRGPEVRDSDPVAVWGRLPTTISGIGIALFETAGGREHWGSLDGVRRNAVAMMESLSDADISIWLDPTGPTGLGMVREVDGEACYIDPSDVDVRPANSDERRLFTVQSLGGTQAQVQLAQHLLCLRRHHRETNQFVKAKVRVRGRPVPLDTLVRYDANSTAAIMARGGAWVTAPKV